MSMDKISSVFDEITAVFSKERLTEEERRHQRYIIVLMKKGRKTSIYKPDRSKFTVGRSSQCDFQVKDPYFPRKAAEIILDPTPLLRLQDSSEEGSQIQHIKPGVKVKFQGYNLVLMDEGDVIKNQHCINRTNDKKKLSISLLLASVFALTILVSKFYFFKGSPRASSEITLNATVPVKLLSATKPVIKNTVQMDKPKRKKSSPRVSKTTATTSPTPALARSLIHESFEKALRQAEAKISGGNLSDASLLIEPYLPLLTVRQKERVVSVLDPHAEDIFRKAYILKAFDRGKSNKMLEMLAEDGMDLLPSVRKALELVSKGGKMEGKRGQR